jgi:hypothetical protein
VKFSVYTSTRQAVSELDGKILQKFYRKPEIKFGNFSEPTGFSFD